MCFSGTLLLFLCCNRCWQFDLWFRGTFSKSSLNIWKFTVHVLLKPDLENFEYYFASMWDECNCAVVWAFFGIAFLRNWNENWPFPVLWPLLSFPNLLAYWVQYQFYISFFKSSVFLIIFFVFLNLYFIYLCSKLYYYLASANFEASLFFFSLLLDL